MVCHWICLKISTLNELGFLYIPGLHHIVWKLTLFGELHFSCATHTIAHCRTKHCTCIPKLCSLYGIYTVLECGLCVGLSEKYRQWCAGCGFPKSCRPPAHRTICGLTLLRSIHCSPCSFFSVAVKKKYTEVCGVCVRWSFSSCWDSRPLDLIVFLLFFFLKPSHPSIRIYSAYWYFD